jgi:flagellar biosynthesis/type III secretory pathway protein FliH
MQEIERRHHLFMVGYHEDLTASKVEGKTEGIAEGIAEGKAEGIAEGKAEGIAEGKAEGRAEGVLDILSDKFGQIPQHVVDSLNQQTDLAVLKSLLIQAARCTSLDEFAAGL